MPTLEETQTRLSYEVAVYREQMGMLQKEMERVSLTTLDLSNAVRTVQNLKEGEILIPIGGGAYIRGTMKDNQVIMPVGSEYSVEMAREEAATELARRVDATRRAVERLNEEFQKIAERLRSVSMQLREVEAGARISKNVDESAKEDYI